MGRQQKRTVLPVKSALTDVLGNFIVDQYQRGFMSCIRATCGTVLTQDTCILGLQKTMRLIVLSANAIADSGSTGAMQIKHG